MTLRTFLARLRQTPRRWRLRRYDGRIRYGRTGEVQCPLTYLAKVRGTVETYEAAVHLGLPWRDAIAIVRAVDNCNGHDPALRRALLRATGLK